MITPAGTTRYLCPLECGWYYDVPPISLENVDWVIPDPGDPNALMWPEYVAFMSSQAIERRMRQTEQTLRDHLSTHTLEQFVRVIHDLREQLARAERATEPAPW